MKEFTAKKVKIWFSIVLFLFVGIANMIYVQSCVAASCNCQQESPSFANKDHSSAINAVCPCCAGHCVKHTNPSNNEQQLTANISDNLKIDFTSDLPAYFYKLVVFQHITNINNNFKLSCLPSPDVGRLKTIRLNI